MKSIIIYLLVLAVISASAADLDLDVSKFDLNKDGHLDKAERLHLFTYIQKRKFLKTATADQLDLNSDPTPKATKAIKAEASIDELSLENDALRSTGKQVASMPTGDMISYLNGRLYTDDTSLGRGLTSEKPIDLAGFQIRHSFNTDLSATTDVGDPTSPSTQANKDDFAKGALFSYTHDFGGHNNTWTADGAILRPINLLDVKKGQAPPGQEIYWSKVDLVPSVTFDKLNTTNSKTAKVDSLVFRTGAVADLFGGPVADIMQFRGYVDDGTDFELKSQVFATELEWEPILHSIGLGQYQQCGPVPVFYATRFYLHSEYTDTFDTGGKKNLQLGSASRFGPRLELDLEPEFLRNLTFSAFYAYDLGLTGNIGESRYYSLALNYNITANFGLAAQYTYGQIPIARDKSDNVNVGLTVKF